MVRYKYYFPFLDTKGEVTVDDNRVGPLYKHVFPPALAPGLSFIGLPWQVNNLIIMFLFSSLLLCENKYLCCFCI